MQNMVDRPWIIKWDFSKEAECFNCHNAAAQLVEITQTETTVTCSSCGAERHYVIHGFFVADKKPDFEADKARRKYDLWKFARSAKCANCLQQADQEIIIDEFRGAVICPLCFFTRIFKFSVYNIPDKAPRQ